VKLAACQYPPHKRKWEIKRKEGNKGRKNGDEEMQNT